MMTKIKLPTQCPGCEQKIQVKVLQCTNCETKIEGSFNLPELYQLNYNDLQLMLDFVRSNGSPKRLSSIYKLSYPAIRSRIDKLIEKIEGIEIGK